MTIEPAIQLDPRVGRKVTWEIYGLTFVGTVKSAFNDQFDGEEFLSVDVESENDGVFPARSPRYPGIPASIYPPGAPNSGNARWVD